MNVVSPGPTETKAILAADDATARTIRPIINATPVSRRMGTLEVIAYAAVFLCEDRARWMNGVHLRANGGHLME